MVTMKDLSIELLKIAKKLAALGSSEEEAKAREEQAQDPFLKGLRGRMLGSFQDAFSHYIKTALWSSTGEDGEPLDDNYNEEDISEQTLQEMRVQLQSFLDMVEKSYPGHTFKGDKLAHDFWLTRNGHGSGFWDGDWPDQGAKLTELSKRFGECDIYEGDDGKLHLM